MFDYVLKGLWRLWPSCVIHIRKKVRYKRARASRERWERRKLSDERNWTNEATPELCDAYLPPPG